MNTIGFPSGGTNNHEEHSKLKSRSTMVELMTNLNNSHNIFTMPREQCLHQDQAAYRVKCINSMVTLRRLLESNVSERSPYRTDDSPAGYSSLSNNHENCYGKKIDSPSLQQIKKSIDLLSEKKKNANYKKNFLPHCALQVSHNTITKEAKRSIVLEACHPHSNCSKAARNHVIPHQYIFKWCKELFSMSIKELKNCLKHIYDNDFSNKQALSELTKIIHTTKTGNKKKTNFTLSQKKNIIKEFCEKKLPVYKIAQRYGIATASVYHWCKVIFHITLKELRHKLRHIPTQSLQTMPASDGQRLV